MFFSKEENRRTLLRPDGFLFDLFKTVGVGASTTRFHRKIPYKPSPAGKVVCRKARRIEVLQRKLVENQKEILRLRTASFAQNDS